MQCHPSTVILNYNRLDATMYNTVDAVTPPPSTMPLAPLSIYSNPPPPSIDDIPMPQFTMRHKQRTRVAPVSGEQHRNDLHEWSMYRQNVTRSLADHLLQRQQQQQQLQQQQQHIPGSVMDTQGEGDEQQAQPNNIPLQSTYRHRKYTQNRHSLHNPTTNANANHWLDAGDAYIKYGLPRVAMPSHYGDSTSSLQRNNFELRGRSKSNNMDMRRSMHAQEDDYIDEEQAMYSGAFMQSKRHHGHYFSNVDLFNQQADGFNYLRYAKADEMQPVINKQPHLVLRNVAFDKDTRTSFDRRMLRTPRYKRLLDGVTMEMFGGETIALLHTNEEQVRALFGLLTNENRHRGSAEGSFTLNGIPMGSRSLGDRIAYVNQTPLYPYLTVRQHLNLACAFVKPATNAFTPGPMVEQLIQTLALTPFHDRLISELGRTEKQRVKIACQILLDTDILILDNIIKYTDLYDAAFVIDYLRDWATKLNRIVIVACNPPTYELLAMFYKTAILANGRLVYCGRTTNLLNYFEQLDYPCPLFKNPCDYYVDLVTHDRLTLEASAESLERIRKLGDIWYQRAPAIGDQVQMGSAPAKVKRANVCNNVATVYGRFWSLLRNQPGRYLSELWLNAIMSSILGVVYFQLSLRSQAGITDRWGLFHSLLTLALLPNLLLNIARVHGDRALIQPDYDRRYYSTATYLTARLLFDIPLAVLMYLIYLLPVYFLSALQPLHLDAGQSLMVYTLSGLLYCMAWRHIAIGVSFSSYSKTMCVLIVGALLLLPSIVDGVTLHNSHVAYWLVYLWLGSSQQATVHLWASNELFGNDTRSATRVLTGDEFETQLLFKEVKKVVRFLGSNIESQITTSETTQTTGGQAFVFGNYTLFPQYINGEDVNQLNLYSLIVLTAWLVFGLLLCCVCVHCKHRPMSKKRHRD